MAETGPARRATEILPPGAPAPDFTLNTTPDQTVRLSARRSHPVILAFYPADWSPVCGDQMALYNEVLPEFQEHGAELFGISVDGAWCHVAFARDRKLRFPLLSDFEPKGAVSRLYGAYREEDGTSERALFVIDGRRDHSLELLLSDRREPGCRRHPERARINGPSKPSRPRCGQ